MRNAMVVLVVVVLVAGVACTPPPPPPLPEGTLAIAYTSVDGLAGYDETSDVLIAKLVDTSHDGLPGAGDTVVTHKYPLSFDPVPEFGDFQVTSHAVHHVETDGPDGPGIYAYLSDASFHWIAWRSEDDVVESWTEMDPTLDPLAIPVPRTTLTDNISPLFLRDVIEVDPLSPSRPSIPLSALSELNHDFTWLEVDFAPGLP